VGDIFQFHHSYGVLENVDKAQTKVRAKKENVAGNDVKKLAELPIVDHHVLYRSIFSIFMYCI
jgi:hypothetical protein